MTDVLAPAAETTPALTQAPSFDSKAAIRSVAVSIVVNAVLPFVAYKVLAPHFTSGSIMPLLYASIFPVLGLAVSLIRTRSIDAIAIFAIFGIAYSIATTLLAGEVHLALIVGSTQGFIIAAVFFVSALIGRPVFFYMARQFVAGNDATARERFHAVHEADGKRTFFIATMVWAAAVALLGLLSLFLAFVLEPATYLLVNNGVNIAVNLVLVGWTIRFTRSRLEAVGERLAAETASVRETG